MTATGKAMNRTQIKLSEAVGKTIECVMFNDTHLVITFPDGLFASVGIDYGYEPGDAELCDDDFEDDYLSDSQRIALGFTTQEAINAAKAEQERRRREQQEASERRTFEALKRKYEGESAAS